MFATGVALSDWSCFGYACTAENCTSCGDGCIGIDFCLVVIVCSIYSTSKIVSGDVTVEGSTDWNFVVSIEALEIEFAETVTSIIG